MPLLDIAVAQPSFPNHQRHTKLRLCINGKATKYSLLHHKERGTSFRKFSRNLGNLNNNLGHQMKLRPKVLAKAVATFEPKFVIQSEDGGMESNASPSTDESTSSTVHIESSDADSEEIDAKEKMRRVRISKANKGNIPWNKGRKHSPETRQLIRVKTKLAMQNPKVRMKLASIGHAQSKETRDKIGVGVRLGWRRRRERMLMQETCLFDWQNLIAEAARKGFGEGEELQWDSYEMLKKQLEKEWLDSIEYRKTMPRPKTNKRAPKSPEQRRKIAEAIAAKWADPEYRARVCSGLAKYHGIPVGAERKAKRKPSGEGRPRRTSKKKASDDEESAVNKLKTKSEQPNLKKPYVPKYKDPLASAKLEMLKSIRAQRVVASNPKINETLERAKLLIAEAEKAAKALELVARRSPVAEASLIETRKLISEATQTIEKIENGDIGSLDNIASGHHQGANNHVGKNANGVSTKEHGEGYPNGINGFTSLQSHQGQNPDFNLHGLTMLNNMDINNHLPKSLDGYELDEVENGDPATQSGPHMDVNSCKDSETNFGRRKQEFVQSDAVGRLDVRGVMDSCYRRPEPNGVSVGKLRGCGAPNGAEVRHIHQAGAAKKWVRGKLVEIKSDDEINQSK